jgi:hypothetical protein
MTHKNMRALLARAERKISLNKFLRKAPSIKDSWLKIGRVLPAKNASEIKITFIFLLCCESAVEMKF